MSTPKRRNATRNYHSTYTKPPELWDRINTLMVGAKEVEYTPCHYCGDPYEEADHAVPLGMVSSLDALTDEQRALLILVPACAECNRIGGAVLDDSLVGRKGRIQAALRVRHKKLLTIPTWTDAEIEELGEALRGFISGRQQAKRRLEERLNW